MDVSGELHAPVALSPKEETGYQLGRRLTGAQNQAERGDKDINLFPYRESNRGRPSRRLITVLTEISRPCSILLLHYNYFCIASSVFMT